MHARCGEVSREEYEMIEQHDDVTWLCLTCHDANFSFPDLDNTTSSMDNTEITDQDRRPRRTHNSRNKLKLIVINFQSMSNKKAELEAIIDQY